MNNSFMRYLLLLVLFSNGLTNFTIAQTRLYRQLPADGSIDFGLSEKYSVEARTCSEAFRSVYTYGITPNDNQVTKKEHLAMFGFDPADGPVTIRISLLNGTDLHASTIELINKTYKGITTWYEEGAFMIQVCEPMKQLMVRMPSDKANPLMIHVDPYDDPEIPEGSNIVVFDGGSNGKIHEQTAQYDRYTVPNDVDAIVIEDGALFKGTIHTNDGRLKPLIIQGRGMVICRFTSKPSNDVKMQYNAMELNNGNDHKIHGLTLVNGRHFAIRVSNRAHAQNVKIYGYRVNNDGIVAGSDSKILNCFFKCNDDHIKLYNARIKVRDCVFYEQTNGALFQMAWNKIDPGDYCEVQNIEVLEWEAGCGDPDLGQGGIARSFINHRESEENGKACVNTTFYNVYIRPRIARLICLNGLDHPITYENLTLQNFTLEHAPDSYNWIYANAADDDRTSIEINFKNVRFGDLFIAQSDFKTKGTVNLAFDNTGEKYTGFLNPDEADSCDACGPPSSDMNFEEGQGIKIYPLPARDYFVVELPESFRKACIQLVSLTGQQYGVWHATGLLTRIPIKHIPKGCYILQVSHEGMIWSGPMSLI